jgi:hypothetical protein
LAPATSTLPVSEGAASALSNQKGKFDISSLLGFFVAVV